jgi:membrane-bound lytic murein transglycosylase D
LQAVATLARLPVGCAPDPRPDLLTGPRARSAILKHPDARLTIHLSLAALLLAACAGGATAPAPVPDQSATPAADQPSAASVTPVSLAGPATAAPEETPALEPVDSVADSAAVELSADEEVLEELRASTPAEATGDDRAARTPSGGAAASELAAVTWDIDVTTFTSHERVQYYLDFFQGPARERFAVWLQRMPRYEPMIRARLAEEGLPGDLLYLALIESGFSNVATSRARAVGMWQFMPSTGRAYGLRVDRWIDERRDPVKATDAAARHLDDLRERFGSLYLAAAAYNAGGGKVSRGLRRLGSGTDEAEDEEERISDSTFFLLYDTQYLRRETKDYVPKLIAAALIAKEPARYGFAPPEPVAPLVYDSIIVPDATGLDVLARLSSTSVTVLRDLNPQFLRLITPPGSRAVVRLPVGTADATRTAYAELPANRRVTFREHQVARNETLGLLSRRYGVPVADIRSANRNIAPNRLRIGMTLIIPVSPAFDPRAVAATEQPAQRRRGGAAQVAGRTTWHRVRSGESWWSISERYNVRLADLQRWNDAGPRDRLRIGQRIRVRAGAVARSDGRTVAPAAASPRRATAAQPTTRPAAVPATYRVRRGDTLSAIALRFRITEPELRRLNQLPASGALQAGKVLKLR